jgi:glutathione S-transferase
MKLYYSPAACSLASHIALREAGLTFTPVKVDLRGKQTEDGRDFKAISDRGYVPLLELDDGRTLPEGVAIMQYVADLAPDRHLAPPAGSFARSELQAWLNFIATELHKGFGPLWNPATDAAGREACITNLKRRLTLVEATLGKQPFLMGEGFTVADGYLFTVLGWARFVKVDLSEFANVQAFLGRVADRPAVQTALKAEGLMG